MKGREGALDSPEAVSGGLVYRYNSESVRSYHADAVGAQLLNTRGEYGILQPVQPISNILVVHSLS